jgi:pentose-5-phosphate-3-epimerase
MVDSVLLLGRVTGEGPRGRAFNDLVLTRVERVRHLIDSQHLTSSIDLQAAGGLELESSVQICRLGATSLPLGSALHREKTPEAIAAYVQKLRSLVQGTETA